MVIENYSENGGGIDIRSAVRNGDVFLAVIAFDGGRAVVGYSHECMEHHILLAKAGLPSLAIDKFFRIAFDESGADWTFVCPPDYKNIDDKSRRIRQFFADGHARISEFLSEIDLLVEIKIPQRYRRHVGAMG